MKNWTFDRVLLVLAVVAVIGQAIYIFSVTQRHQRQINEIMEGTQNALNVIIGEVTEIEKERASDVIIIDSILQQKEKADEELEQSRDNTGNLDILDAESFFARRYRADSAEAGKPDN